MKLLSTIAWDGMELEPWPIPASNILAGNPDASGAMICMTPDKTSASGLWQCLPGRFRWDYTWNETIYILAGKGEIRSDNGECCPILPGRILHFSEGLSSTWTIQETVRKFFFLQSDRPLQL